ncbi:MAG: efflux RND transporter periplasmic adaptor subunit, partial [Bacteroidales bacterium]|nr:efflux RND transporter periplasmic adaptor subunit [Bacteroidales bacterium]
PKTVGEGTLTVSYAGESFTLPIEVFEDDHEAHEAVEAAEVKSANGLSFPKEKSWSVEFATAEAKLEPFGQVIKTMARVENSQADEQTVVAGASGIISLSSLVEGQQVRASQVICKIAGGGLSDNNLAVKYTEAEAEYNLAKADFERKKSLAEDNIVSQSKLQAAEGRYNSAKAAYENLRRNFSSEGQNVKSTVDGFVRSVFVRNGQYVEAGQPIAVVAKSSTVLLRAEVQPRYFQNLRNISDATFSILNSGKVWTLSDLSGKVLGYGRGVSDGSNLIPVTFQVNNRADFLPGSFVQTYIHTQDTGLSLTIPSSSIIEEMGDYFVYKQLTPEYFEKVQVKTGSTDGISTEILSGLEEGDRVVSKGAILVKLSASSGALDPHAGHVH